MSNEELDNLFLFYGSRFTLSPYKRDMIQKILLINHHTDIFQIKTRYADSLCSLIQTKYEAILSQYNAFCRYGYFRIKKPYLGCFSEDQLKQIKIRTHQELIQYYNDVLIPMLQRCSEKNEIISITNHKFKRLEDKSHLIK